MIVRAMNAGAKFFGMELAAFSIVFALGALTGAYALGDHKGFARSNRQWEDGAAKAETRADNAHKEIGALGNSTAGVIKTETNTIIQTDQTALLENATLKGKIQQLEWRLQNEGGTTSGDCRIPDTWRLQHKSLDDIISGGDQAVGAAPAHNQP